MATDFSKKTGFGNPVHIGSKTNPNQPTDVRCRIETIDEMELIEYPFIGMLVYVLDEDKFYIVKSIRDVYKVPGVEASKLPGYRVDTYEEFKGGNCNCSFTFDSVQKLLDILYDINNGIDVKNKIDELTNMLQNQGGGNTGGDSGDDEEGDSPTVDYKTEPWNPDAYTDKQIALKMTLNNTGDVIGTYDGSSSYNLSIEGSTYTIEDITINRNGKYEFYKIITLDNLPTKVSFAWGSYIEEVIHMCNTSNITDMYEMFYSCRALISINANNFDTSNVTNMERMFNYCNALTTIEGISSWNTSNVTDMTSVFSSCKSLTSLDISSWSTGKVTSMYGMFAYCDNLTELDISNWNYINTNANGMNNMFCYCFALELSNIKMDNCSQDIKTKIKNAHSFRNRQQN